MGNSLGRAMRSEGSRLASASKTSTSSGVVNLHWNRERSARITRTQAKANAQVGSATLTRTPAKANAKVESEKAQPDFVILGGDPQ